MATRLLYSYATIRISGKFVSVTLRLCLRLTKNVDLCTTSTLPSIELLKKSISSSNSKMARWHRKPSIIIARRLSLFQNSPRTWSVWILHLMLSLHGSFWNMQLLALPKALFTGTQLSLMCRWVWLLTEQKCTMIRLLITNLKLEILSSRRTKSNMPYNL